ncbi:MAG: ribulokinase, partial [Armatimonadetes bacterium]|nr:ribulokinase [Armatimonadota bacterium]
VIDPYPHGVLTRALPDGTPLPADWALQHPGDYLVTAERLLRDAKKAAGTNPIVGIGLDFTASTILPAARDGTPLCLLPEFARRPHAWVMLWKHHAAQLQADRINAMRPAFLELYGGRTSSEWLHAKSLQILEEAPDVFEAADRIIEAGDWVIWQLISREVRSACQAGYKAHWQPEYGYPPASLLGELHPKFPALSGKLGPPHPVGERAGGLTHEWAERTGLPEGLPVAVAVIDAHAALPGLGVGGPGTLVMVMGTSTCHLLLSRHKVSVPGISGVVRDGVLPGLFAYEAGQAATGDALEWWVRTLAWASDGGGDTLFARLNQEAASLPPGAGGLVALDWWNGSRTPLVNADLAAVLAGLTVGTSPAQIYRGIVEATAYGTRQVIELFESGRGIEPVTELRVCGGLSRSPLVMQIYADVTGRTLRASATPHASARGAAVYGALAAGRAGGGYDAPEDALVHMGVRDFTAYAPDRAAHERYTALYSIYRDLHRHFGEGDTVLMRRLREMRH